MKRRTTAIAGLVALICGGFLATAAVTSSHQVGVLVSDAEASTIRGGACTGSEEFKCDVQPTCSGEVRYRSTAGSCYKWDCKTDWRYCNGSANCTQCYVTNAPSCSS